MKAKWIRACMVGLVVSGILGCTTLPTPPVRKYSFPKGRAFIGEPERPYEVLGWVRSRASWNTLDPVHEEGTLCENYYNKAVRELVRRSRENGGDAVADVKSVVFLFNGQQETHSTPECSDDGEEGQILLQGVAIKWKDTAAEKAFEEQTFEALPGGATKPSIERPVSPQKRRAKSSSPKASAKKERKVSSPLKELSGGDEETSGLLQERPPSPSGGVPRPHQIQIVPPR